MSFASLALGASALLGADHGMPVWIQVPVYLWLLTLGLPTTLTVLAAATMWGRFQPLYGLMGFIGACLVAAPVVQVSVMHGLRCLRDEQGNPGSAAEAGISNPPSESQ